MKPSVAKRQKDIIIVLGIDGTDSKSWMKKDGSNSSVFKFVRDSSADYKAYFSGPNTFGTDDNKILEDCVRKFHAILQKINCGGRVVRVYLTGHSRGGLIAINLAKKIKAITGQYVTFAALYDAVDRDIDWFDVIRLAYSPKTGETPDSIDNSGGMTGVMIDAIKFTAHARRSMTVESRGWFGNTGTKSSLVYEQEFFDTSHGGMGGDPIYIPPKPGKWLDMLSVDDSCSSNHHTLPDESLRRNKSQTIYNIQELCYHESKRADKWLRDKAREKGLSFTGGG